MVALGLLFWLRFERSHRDDDLNEADSKYFSRQDARRNAGLAILLLPGRKDVAISPQIDRRDGERTEPAIPLLWLVLFLLIWSRFASLDMMATRAYASSPPS